MVGFRLPALLLALLAGTTLANPLQGRRSLQRRYTPQIGRSDGKKGVLKPKVVIVSLVSFSR